MSDTRKSCIFNVPYLCVFNQAVEVQTRKLKLRDLLTAVQGASAGVVAALVCMVSAFGTHCSKSRLQRVKMSFSVYHLVMC